MIKAIKVIHSHHKADDNITLSYNDRFRRRIGLTSDGGVEFLLDLQHTTDLRQGDHLVLEDGRHIEVLADDEPLMKVTCKDALHLTRMAWHVGNRHLACEIHRQELRLQYDHVVAEMLENLGGCVEIISGPFNPEGGAYGRGRIHSHAH